MIVVLATVELKPDRVADYERLFQLWAPQFRANVPGMLFYQMLRDPVAPTTYRAIEAYRDEAAMRMHFESDLLKAAIPGMYDCMVGEPRIEFLNGVEG